MRSESVTLRQSCAAGFSIQKNMSHPRRSRVITNISSINPILRSHLGFLKNAVRHESIFVVKKSLLKSRQIQRTTMYRKRNTPSEGQMHALFGTCSVSTENTCIEGNSGLDLILEEQQRQHRHHLGLPLPGSTETAIDYRYA